MKAIAKKVAVMAVAVTMGAGAAWALPTVSNVNMQQIPYTRLVEVTYDLTGGPTTNAYPVCYYTSIEALPYGGLTNSIYKHTQLVMRKVSRGAFTMGEGTGAKQVILTQDFYAGVFQVTQGQWYNVMGTQPSQFNDIASRTFRPVEKVSYFDIREDPANKAISPNWPASSQVHADSFMGKLRTKTGLSGFDLPTEAQWEYACRAGTTTCFNDGNGDANVDGANASTNVWLNALGRYKFDGGYINGVTAPAAGCGPANGTAIARCLIINDTEIFLCR